MTIIEIIEIIVINFAGKCSFGDTGIESVGSQVVYELDYRNPVLYVILIQSILGKLPVVPVSDTGTIPYHLHSLFPGAPGDRRPGAGCGLSTRGHWDGPVTCNDMGQGICASVVPHGKRIAIIAIIAIKQYNNSQ